MEGPAGEGAVDRIDCMETEGSEWGGGPLLGGNEGCPTPGGGERRAACPFDTCRRVREGRRECCTVLTRRERLDCWGEADRESSWGLRAVGRCSVSVVCVGDIWRARGLEANGIIVRMVGLNLCSQELWETAHCGSGKKPDFYPRASVIKGPFTTP